MRWGRETKREGNNVPCGSNSWQQRRNNLLTATAQSNPSTSQTTHTHTQRAAVPSTASLARVAMPEYPTSTPPPKEPPLDVSWLPSTRQSRISTVLSLASEAKPIRRPPPWPWPSVLVATLLVKWQPVVVERGSRGYHKCAPEHEMDGGGVGGGGRGG